MSTVALIDYGSGNVHSAARALNRAGEGLGGVKVMLTHDPDAVRAADRIVLPGVGHFADCMAALSAQDGLVAALEEAVIHRATPFLGICVGMQLMADFSLEDGDHAGLGWLHGRVLGLDPGPGLVVPHMGWNDLHIHQPHPVLADLGETPHAYFVHSYAFAPEDERHIAATTDYGAPIVAVVARDNLVGTQFHPEKSQRVGLAVLSNFLSWAP